MITAIACRWLDDGTVGRLEAEKRDDARTRQAIAREAFAGLPLVGHPSSYFVWLPLAEDARADRIAASLARRGISVSTAEPFATSAHIRRRFGWLWARPTSTVCARRWARSGRSSRPTPTSRRPHPPRPTEGYLVTQETPTGWSTSPPGPGPAGSAHRTATSRSRSTASWATCARSPSSAPTAPSTGSARPASTPRACSAPCSTRTRAATSPWPPAPATPSRSSSTCPTPTSCSPGSRARTRSARSSTSWSRRPRPTGKARDLLVRQARAVRGTATFEVACHPAFDYGRAGPRVEIVQGVGAVFTSPLGRVVLRTDRRPQGRGERGRRHVHPGRG